MYGSCWKLEVLYWNWKLLCWWKMGVVWVWQELLDCWNWKWKIGRKQMAHSDVHSNHWFQDQCCRYFGNVWWYYDGIHIFWNKAFQTYWFVLFWFCCVGVLWSYWWKVNSFLNLAVYLGPEHAIDYYYCCCLDLKWHPWTLCTGFPFVYLALLRCCLYSWFFHEVTVFQFYGWCHNFF